MELLELQHLTGFTGKSHASFTHFSSDQITYPIGSQLIIASLSDPHDQTFLNQHLTNIKCVKSTKTMLLSASNDLLVVYHYESQKLKSSQLPLSAQVRSLDLSEDERFIIAATATNCWIWSIESDGDLLLQGSLGGSSGMADDRDSGYETALFLPFSDEQLRSRRKNYELVVYSRERGLEKLTWGYDARSMQYTLDGRIKFQLPGRIAGLKRSIGDAVVVRDSQDQPWCIVGTESGEAMIFNASSCVYRAVVLVCSGGILSMNVLSEGGSSTEVVIGGGDGSIRVIRGHDTKWDVVREGRTHGRVTSLSVSGNHLLCGSDDGVIQLFDCSTTLGRDIKPIRIVSESHTGRIGDVAFCATSNDFFVTVSDDPDDGTIRRWNLNDYSLTHLFTTPKGVRVLKCVYSTEDEIVVGCSDGFIRAFSMSENKLKWQVVNAHRGAVTALAVNDKYICSGGEDSCIRLWAAKSRELIGQFTGEHTKTISDLQIDVEAPFILHSCSADRSVLTFDLSKNKRLTFHASSSKSQNRAFTCLTQKLTGERELITGSSDGNLSFWDIDYRDAVDQIANSEDMQRVNCVQISPKTGQFLASVGDDGLLYLWDVAAEKGAKLIAKGRVHACPVKAVRWSPDQRQIITVAEDASIGVWSWFME
mmetsp:Transcript_1714/g.5990  ORF Transcript_1714/g.5990 Transcript_1714/m.5990 type:complete len:648 (-) Transcript_1714:54-1997(-)